MLGCHTCNNKHGVGHSSKEVRAPHSQPRGPWFETNCCRFETWAILFTPLYLCLLHETLKPIGPFYLVSKTGEVEDPTRIKCVTRLGLTTLI